LRFGFAIGTVAVCPANLASGIFVAPVFHDGIGGLVVPFFVPLQIFQCRRQKMFRPVVRRMSQRLQQILGDQDGNFMRGKTQQPSRFVRRQPFGMSLQIQKTFLVWIHTSSLNAHAPVLALLV
jgi:hypothetical protein